MSALDITETEFGDACLMARRSLMWDVREQAEPRQMLRLSLAADYVEGYKDKVRDMSLDKVLVAFEMSLADDDRQVLDGLAPGKGLDPSTMLELTTFLEDVAKAHADRDLNDRVIDCESANYVAECVRFAGELAGASEYEVARRVVALRSHRLDERANPPLAEQAADLGKAADPSSRDGVGLGKDARCK